MNYVRSLAVPLWLWVGVSALGLPVAQYRVYTKLRAERDELFDRQARPAQLTVDVRRVELQLVSTVEQDAGPTNPVQWFLDSRLVVTPVGGTIHVNPSSVAMTVLASGQPVTSLYDAQLNSPYGPPIQCTPELVTISDVGILDVTSTHGDQVANVPADSVQVRIHFENDGAESDVMVQVTACQQPVEAHPLGFQKWVFED